MNNKKNSFFQLLGINFLVKFISNPYVLFGFLWGLPIPLIVLVLHYFATDRPFHIDSCLPIFEEYPIYWIFILHPIIFAIAFGIVGLILQRKDKKIRELIQHLQNESITDPLTQLFNRRRISRIIQREIIRAQKSNEAICLALIDIDCFKQVNDTHGHLVGDHVLCMLANTLESVLRPSDSVGRWGGEEFLVLLPNTSLEHAFEVLERVRKVVEGLSFKAEESKFSISISAGISVGLKGDSIDSLTKKADIALYQAKEKGRNCCVCFYEDNI